jgi:hypothetical protein
VNALGADAGADGAAKGGAPVNAVGAVTGGPGDAGGIGLGPGATPNDGTPENAVPAVARDAGAAGGIGMGPDRGPAGAARTAGCGRPGARAMRLPPGGVVGAPSAGSVVSSTAGRVMVAVMPFFGELPSRTWMSWRAARLPAT